MVEVRVWREGKLALTKDATFDREATARAWLKRQEAEFAKPGAIEAAKRPKGTLADLFDCLRRRGALPLHMLTAFANFSTRRQEEIARIVWRDLEPSRVMVRDQKNPGEKKGNDEWCGLAPEAGAIAAAMPRADERIVPYESQSISATITRACRVLGIVDLRFHYQRHEGISRLLEMGRTIPRAAEMSGHRSWQSLQRWSHLRQTGDRLAGWDGCQS